MPLILFYNNTAHFESLFLRPVKSPLGLSNKNKIQKSWTEQFGKVADKMFLDMAKQHKNRFIDQNLISCSKNLKKYEVLVYKPQPKGKCQKLSALEPPKTI